MVFVAACVPGPRALPAAQQTMTNAERLEPVSLETAPQALTYC
jgi:hypothetical protein